MYSPGGHCLHLLVLVVFLETEGAVSAGPREESCEGELRRRTVWERSFVLVSLDRSSTSFIDSSLTD
jgi:hypothetical protein